MINQKVARGMFLIAVALFFGVQAATYNIGDFARAGPGLFPLMVCSIVALIGMLMIIEARFEQPKALTFEYKNIAIVLTSLAGFVLISHFLNMVLAIVFLVYFSTLAGTGYSVMRNLKISIVLIGIAFAFRSFLGLSLPLY